MRKAVTILQFAVRILALLLVVLGVLFWMGRSRDLVPVHMRMGQLLIVLLWILAGMGARAGVKPGLAAGALVYGFVVYLFAINMFAFLPGPAHEVIRVVHLLIGLGAVGLAEAIGARIKRAAAA